MIELKELKIGNIVYPIISGDVVEFAHKITAIGHQSVFIGGLKDIEGGVEAKFEELSVVPITEDILIKFGFEKIEIPLNDSTSIYGFKIDNGEYFMLKSHPLKPAIFLEYYYGKVMKGVHQLQNLYFALTGKELNTSL